MKKTLISLTTIFVIGGACYLYVSSVSKKYHRGYCFEEERYLKTLEIENAVIQYALDREAAKMETPAVLGYSYSNVADFRDKNSDCCELSQEREYLGQGGVDELINGSSFTPIFGGEQVMLVTLKESGAHMENGIANSHSYIVEPCGKVLTRAFE